MTLAIIACCYLFGLLVHHQQATRKWRGKLPGEPRKWSDGT